MYSNSKNDELEPRPVPKPTQYQVISARTEVPELSIVFDSSESIAKAKVSNSPSYYATRQSAQETYGSYNEWKNRKTSPVNKETRFYEPREKHSCGSSSFTDCNQNPYNYFTDKVSYDSSNNYHKCACQNAPTVKDIYNMMQMQNDQIKFLLETVQKLSMTLSNQQNQHKCCCFLNSHCKNVNDNKPTELLKTSENPVNCQLDKLNDNSTEKPLNSLKKGKSVPEKNESNKGSKPLMKPDNISKDRSKPLSKQDSISKDRSKQQIIREVADNEKDNKKDIERTNSVASDESFDLNANDVQVIEAPISPDQSIHIEMKSSSEDSNDSECEEENSKKIEVGWTIYNNIIGQVNNLLEDSEQKSEVAKPVKCIKPTPTTKSKNFEPYPHIMLTDNGKIDSSLQMQALAMQYLAPEQSVKCKLFPMPYTIKEL
ncbi:Hypothetical protein CINCED_3A009822 [Cinara cedri]|uniref:Uncharacterized protein n=1 Tax=Cinara cedri TaxID=506608 RepID=A0A5E4MH57_9HEMI|nr:Hypothetical protein CINCED_3A009822 [Cinara cedri]